MTFKFALINQIPADFINVCKSPRQVECVADRRKNYCGLANGNSSNYRAITLLTLDYVGVNNWPSCSHFDKTLIIGNLLKDYRIPASHSFFLQCPDTHWSSARMSVFLEKSITSDDKSRISALLKTKRTVCCEYPSREIQVVRHRMTDALCNSTISDH